MCVDLSAPLHCSLAMALGPQPSLARGQRYLITPDPTWGHVTRQRASSVFPADCLVKKIDQITFTSSWRLTQSRPRKIFTEWALGSGPRYQMQNACNSRMSVCFQTSATQFLHVRLFSDSCNVQKKCDMNHIPLTTACWALLSYY